MSFQIGTLVVSCKGRDSATVFAVVGVTEAHVLLANGRKRKLDKPKLKKIKHVKSLELMLGKDLVQAFEEGRLTNKMLYRGIKNVSEENSLNNSI